MQNKQVTVSVVKAKFFKDEAHFSLRQMVLFGLFFAALGAYFIWHSFAAAPIVASLEAEQMTSLPINSIVADSTASGGSAVLFTDKTLASHSVSLPSQATSLSIRAKGVQCNGAPIVVVKRVDTSQTLLTQSVSATSFTDYPPVAIDLPGGAHNISIQFTNPTVQTV